jgi:hypothetical protein
MSTYTPNNQYVFNQAYAGAVAGLLGQSTPLVNTRGAYASTVAIAGAWAQEVDTQWNTSTNPDQFQFQAIFAFSNDLFQVTEPQVSSVSTLPATYLKSANALLAVLTDAETYLTSIGITPNTIGAAGLNFVGSRMAGIHAQTQSAANPVAVAAVAVQQKRNGLWECDIDVAFASGTTAKTVEIKAVLIPFTTLPQVFSQSAGAINSNNPEVGPVYSNVAIPVADIVAQLNQDAAGVTASGLLYGGTAPVDTATNAVVLWDRKVDTLTGELSNGDLGFSSHDIAGYGPDGKQLTGFAFGKWTVLCLELMSTAGGDVVSFQNLTMSLREVA